MMNEQELAVARDQFIAEHGPWTGHRIHLGGNVYTREDNPDYCLSHRIALYRRIMRDFGVIGPNNIRVLDLGCLEGAFSIDFARQGADVVGIDGRSTNVEHARFSATMLGLADRCNFVVEDVRKLESLGQYDIVLCVGILYHLTAEDAISVLRQIAGSGAVLVIIDTHVSPDALGENRFKLSEVVDVVVNEETYRGRWYQEFPDGLNTEQKIAWSTGSALDNERSFWFTADDLRRVVEGAGFHAYEVFRQGDCAAMVGRR